jgi:hypothetical protein
MATDNVRRINDTWKSSCQIEGVYVIEPIFSEKFLCFGSNVSLIANDFGSGGLIPLSLIVVPKGLLLKGILLFVSSALGLSLLKDGIVLN